jgi:hypothetical protein
MLDNYIISMLILLACVLISRMISDKAIKNLDADKKAELVDFFTGSRKKYMILVFAMVVIFFSILKFNLLEINVLTFVYALIFLIILFIRLFNSYKKLIQSNFPTEFIKNFLIANSISVLGIIIFFGFMIFQ